VTTPAERPSRSTLSPTFRVREVAARLRVDQHRVLAWIRSGRLRALNVAEGTGKKARWRVTPEALAEFEVARTISPPAKVSRRARSGWNFQYF
jgi:excisionase family DNA binding protein